MSLIAAVVCLSQPFPVDSGTKLRSYSAISALKELGYRVVVFYPGTSAGENRQICSALGVEKVIEAPYIPPPTLFDKVRARLSKRFNWSILSAPRSFAPRPSVREFLLNSTGGISFEVVITEYSDMTEVGEIFPANVRILDLCDILSLHYRLVAEVGRTYSKWRKRGDEAFLDLPPTKAANDTISAKETSRYSRFDGLIHIAASEEKLVSGTPGLPPSILIPPCIDLPDGKAKTYDGLPIFPYSGNIFNIQGLAHFMHRILPLIIRQIPEFRLVVTGSPPDWAKDCPHFECVGHVESFGECLHGSSFAVIPVFNGTGQQLKIPEAMAYGLPVAAYRCRVDKGVLNEECGGILADNETEFANGVIALWRDRALANRMGGDALNHVRRNLSQSNYTEGLRQMLLQCGAVMPGLASELRGNDSTNRFTA